MPFSWRDAHGFRADPRLQAALLFVLLALCAWQAARLTWLLATPPAPLGTLVPASAGHAVPALAGLDPFAATQAGGSASAEGFQLLGVRLSPAPASAILVDSLGQQSGWAQGDLLPGGLQLHGVEADHVLLRLPSGIIRRLDMPAAIDAAPAPAAAPLAIPATTPAPGNVDPARLLSGTGLVPSEQAGRIVGYTLMPRNNEALLRQAGLQAGDVLTAINGNALSSPERLADLQRELAGGSGEPVSLTIQRDGQTQTIQLRTPSP